MAINAKLSRPDYRKFRLSDLNLDIKENPSPRNYAVAEGASGSLISNPIYDYKEISHLTPRAERKTVDIFIYTKVIDEVPVVSFVIGDKEYSASMFFKATNNVVNKAIEPEYQLATQIGTGGASTKITKTVRDYIIDYVTKYGIVQETTIKSRPNLHNITLLVSLLRR